ncbi:MAG: thiamine pyrophosphate-dependent enzyme [Clostridiales bacterium]|nr:thiamine pyrophosphate-dependent enzyme [Clostridiales bacterium]
MKVLMLGNEAVARGVYESGVTVACAYPGTPSTEITEYISKYDEIYTEWSVNEKVSLEVAIGASMAGARAFCAMKHVGLNVAADPLFTCSYTGVNGGLVIAVADDPGMHSSQNEQDSRHYARAAKVPMLEPSDSEECKDYIIRAFKISEEYDTPVLLRLSTRVSHSRTIVETALREDYQLKEYNKNIDKFVMMPAMARKRHVEVEKRTTSLSVFSDTSDINKIEWGDRKAGIITSGIAYQYTKEAFPGVSFLKIGMVHPLPQELIRSFAAGVEELYVVEELDSIIEDYVKMLGIKVQGKNLLPFVGELSLKLLKEKIPIIINGNVDDAETLCNSEALCSAENIFSVENIFSAENNSCSPETSHIIETSCRKVSEIQESTLPLPARPPVLCPGCPHRGVFHVLAKLKLIVTGDIGCYTLGALPPTNAMDSCVCMGASISMAHGFDKARGSSFSKRTVAVIGDSTFIHSGITSLIDIVYNKGISTVIILDNSITGMTGHQHNPTTGYTIKGEKTFSTDLIALAKAIGIDSVRVFDPFDIVNSEAVIKEELAKDEPSVLIARRPCALLKGANYGPVLTINQEKCKKCRRCLSIGCPAISINNAEDNMIEINEALCSGCALCLRLCRFDAMEKR